MTSVPEKALKGQAIDTSVESAITEESQSLLLLILYSKGLARLSRPQDDTGHHVTGLIAERDCLT